MVTMDVQIHLVAMPWGVKHIPSIQVGVLKAYLKKHFPKAQVTGHHLHFAIPTKIFPEAHYWKVVAKNFHESYYLYLLSRRFPEASFPEAESLYEELRGHAIRFNPRFEFLSKDELLRLEEVTRTELEERIVRPALAADKILVGMVTNFHQTYANVYAYFYLRERLRGKSVVFVFGGASISYPQVVETLGRIPVDGYAIIGEGERKLREFAERFSRGEELDRPSEGVYHLLRSPDLHNWNENWFRSQVKSIDELPLPDYEEYFQLLDVEFAGHRDWPHMRKLAELPMEGSRGCAFSCEFCNLNRFWEGYRKLPGEVIAERALELSERYRVKRVRFVDNLCDAWARKYAETLNARNLELRSMMELRPKHPEEFWDVLKKSGLKECQIGIEGLDEGILKRVKKGTTVLDVVSTQKFLTERLITKGSRQLIAFYPGSNEEEVANTRRTLELMLHMPRIDVGKYLFEIDSPLYRSLPDEVRRKAHVKVGTASAMPRARDDFSVYFTLEVPDEIAPTAGAMVAWEEFFKWYKSISPDYWWQHYLLIEDSVIYDARSGALETIPLSAAEEKVYEACHIPVNRVELGSRLGLDQEQCDRLLDGFLEKRLMIESQGKLLSLALRLKREDLGALSKGNLMTVIPARND